MSLHNEIYNFFNEGRPRTVNKDVEDIKKGQLFFKGDDTAYSGETRGRKRVNQIDPKKEKEREDRKKNLDRLPADVESIRSSFEKGKVHEIWFKNIFPGQPRKYFSLYRKLTEQEFDKIYRGGAYTLTSPKIIPSDKQEHDVDIYYLKTDMGMPNEKEGFFSLTKEELGIIKREYPDYAKKLESVSIEDISKGVNLRYYSFENIKKTWDDKKSYSQKRKEKSAEKFKKDTEKSKQKEDKVTLFFVQNDDLLNKIIGLYNQFTKPGQKSADIEEYRDLADQFIKRYLNKIKELDSDSISRVLGGLKEKLKDKNRLYTMILTAYGKNGDTAPKDVPKAEPIQKAEKPKPEKKSTDKKVNPEDKAKQFMLDNRHISTLNKLIQAYAASEERDEKGVYKNDRIERQYQRDQIFVIMPTLLKQVNDFSQSFDVKDLIVNDMIRNRIAALTGDDNTELYNMISKTYNAMKERELKKQKSNITEAAKKYLVKTNPGSQVDSIYKKASKELNTDDKGNPIPGEYLVNLDDDQIPKLKSSAMKDKGIVSIEPYTAPPATSEPIMPEDKLYKISVKVGDNREQETQMIGKKLVSLLKNSPDYKNIDFSNLKEKDPYIVKRSGQPDMVITLKSKTPVGQSGERTKIDTIDAKQSAKNRKENEPETRKVTVKIPYQKPQTVSYAVNKGVKMAKQNPSELIYKFYVVDTKDNSVVKGFDDFAKAKEEAKKMGPDYKAMQRAEMILKGISEALSKEDVSKLKSTRVSFTIQSDLDPDKQFNISDNVREVKEEKGKVIIVLAEAGVITFDKEGTGIFKYSKDNKEYQALNVPSDLNSIIKKSLSPVKDDKAAEPKLESYIRKRIRQAIKEAEVSQYWGYQGKDVKKKRLEEYLKKYDWGFQDSDNPYTHAEGSAKHAIVSKLVHELEAMGVDAIAIFNSYAPKNYQVSDIDQLDYASDSPLGSQLTQPYNPDSLTARGGRVAEEDGKVTSIAQQYLDRVNAKYKDVEGLAKGYNSKDVDIMGSSAVKSVVQKAIATAYGKDASKASPELKKAFMSISDEDLKKSR